MLYNRFDDSSGAGLGGMLPVGGGAEDTGIDGRLRLGLGDGALDRGHAGLLAVGHGEAPAQVGPADTGDDDKARAEDGGHERQVHSAPPMHCLYSALRRAVSPVMTRPPARSQRMIWRQASA